MHLLFGWRRSTRLTIGKGEKPEAALWNTQPNIDAYPELNFDWRFPQFLHNRERHQRRHEEFDYYPTQVMPYGDGSVQEKKS